MFYMDAKKSSLKNHLDFCRKIRCTKSLAFCVISFVIIFFLTYFEYISCSSLLQRNFLTTPEAAKVLGLPHFDGLNDSSSTFYNSGILQHEIEDDDGEDGDDDDDPLIPPKEISKKERMKWFRGRLPELEILHSSTLSENFHSRILNVFNRSCSILFHITWLSPANSFGKREFLTMDTLFKAHPEGCLIIISKIMDSKRGYRILKPLLDKGFTIFAITLDLPFLVKNTPAESWLEEMNSGNKDPGQIPLSQNLSNLLRLAMLYKYGGVYIDTDVIILKDFSVLRNAIGAQSVDSVTKNWTRLNGAIMIFDIKHPILLDFLKEFASTLMGVNGDTMGLIWCQE